MEPSHSGLVRTPRATRGATRTDVAAPPDDLAAVVDAWPELPGAIRAGILAMVKASTSNE